MVRGLVWGAGCDCSAVKAPAAGDDCGGTDVVLEGVAEAV